MRCLGLTNRCSGEISGAFCRISAVGQKQVVFEHAHTLHCLYRQHGDALVWRGLFVVLEYIQINRNTRLAYQMRVPLKLEGMLNEFWVMLRVLRRR